MIGTLLLAAVCGWFTYQLAHAPRDRGLRAVVACLALQLVGKPLVGGEFATVAVVKLVQNIAMSFSWFSLMLFFLYSARGSRRRAWWEAVPVTAVCVLMTLSVLAIPAPARNHVFMPDGALPEDMRVSGVAVFYLVGSCYFVYAMSQSALWASRYASEANPRTRVGLWMASAGLTLMACIAMARSVVVIVRWAGGGVSNAVATAVDAFVPIAGLLFLGGVCYPAVVARLAALRVWLRHRRIYHDLRPLWKLLHEAFPQDALDTRPRSAWWDRMSPWRTHRRYWRRVVEIRDGLVQISPYLTDAGFSSQRPAYEQVDKLREALRRKRENVRPGSSSAVLVAAPMSADPAADVAELVGLARALAPTTTQVYRATEDKAAVRTG